MRLMDLFAWSERFASISLSLIVHFPYSFHIYAYKTLWQMFRPNNTTVIVTTTVSVLKIWATEVKKNVYIRGSSSLNWDTAHPDVRSSSPEVRWCSCFIQWVTTWDISSFGLFMSEDNLTGQDGGFSHFFLHSNQKNKITVFTDSPFKITFLNMFFLSLTVC